MKNEPTVVDALRDLHRLYSHRQITLFTALEAELGPKVAEIVERENCSALCRTLLKGTTGAGTIDELIGLLWEPLRDRGFEFEVDRSAEGVRIRCTRCPWATLYRGLGGSRWGFRLYCAADAPLAAGFNPKIGFKRTRTLMEGDEECDHFYYMRR